MGKEKKSNLFEEMNTREGLGNLEIRLLQNGGFDLCDRKK